MFEEIDDAMKALNDLNGDLRAVSYDPHDPGSIEAAIKDGENQIDDRAGRYSSNPIVAPMIESMKEQLRSSMLEHAAEERTKNTTPNDTKAMTTNIFQKIDNAILDLQSAGYPDFKRPVQTLGRLLEDPSLININKKLTKQVDLDNFLEISSNSTGSMAGSAELVWPVNHTEVLGIQLSLIQKFSKNPNEMIDFGLQFYNTSNSKYISFIRNVTRGIIIPFARDYKDYAETHGLVKSPLPQTNSHITQNNINIAGNVSGSNLQQGSHKSTQSINNPDELLQGITALLKEIDEAQAELSITEESKSEFHADIATLKAQIQSSNPKGSILKESLASIKRILEGAAGSVVPELIKKIPDLISMIQ